MDSDFKYKQVIDDSFIEYNIIPYSDDDRAILDEKLKINAEKIEALSKKIDDLAVDADSWDYAVSVLSGSMAGLFDVLIVGELSLCRNINECREFGDKQAEDIVKKTAKLFGYDEKKDGDSLEKSIRFLEKKFPLASDQKNIKNAMGGGLQHHFRDFTHHPTIIGWIFSIIMQYTGYVFGTNTFGMLIWEKVDDETHLGKNDFEKILYGTIHWLFHMVSDMAGSSSTPGEGTGLPGPILSLIKELDAIRVKLKNILTGSEDVDKLTKYLSKLFNGTQLADHDSQTGKVIKGTELRFDLRAEMGVFHNVKEISELFLPVVINECFVRSFYFIKRFFMDIKANSITGISDLDKLNWKKIIPFNNATLTRMLTISVGTMEVIDVTDAAIRGAVEAAKKAAEGGVVGASGGPVGAAAGASTGAVAAFWKTFALHVNYAGVGRFVICLGTEATFEYRRQKLLLERLNAYDEAISLNGAKLLYCEKDMWVAAYEAGKEIDEVYKMMNYTETYISDTVDEINQNIKNISKGIIQADEKNPGLKEDILNAIKWGV